MFKGEDEPTSAPLRSKREREQRDQSPQQRSFGAKASTRNLMQKISSFIYPIQPALRGNTWEEAEHGNGRGSAARTATSAGNRASLLELSDDFHEMNAEEDNKVGEAEEVHHVVLDNDIEGYLRFASDAGTPMNETLSQGSGGLNADLGPATHSRQSTGFLSSFLASITPREVGTLQRCYRFLNPRFDDCTIEKSFRDESWWSIRQTAFPCSFFYIVAVSLPFFSSR